MVYWTVLLYLKYITAKGTKQTLINSRKTVLKELKLWLISIFNKHFYPKQIDQNLRF